VNKVKGTALMMHENKPVKDSSVLHLAELLMFASEAESAKTFDQDFAKVTRQTV
jgi:hypothetical protein